MLHHHNEGAFRGARNTELYYQSWHPGGTCQGVVIGIHGHGDHSGGLRNLIKHLVPSGYAWYGFDLRGHGRSPGVRGHVQHWSDFLDDLQAFIDRVRQIEGKKAVFLLGHSLGGLITIEYGLRHPDDLSGIISNSPALGYSRFSPLIAQILRSLSYLKPRMILQAQPDYTKLTRDQAEAKILAADPLRHEQMSLSLWREFHDSQRWVRMHAGELRVPLLMLYGLDDTITPALYNRQFLKSLVYAEREYHEYAQARHRPFDDVNRAQVFTHIEAWLGCHNNAA